MIKGYDKLTVQQKETFDKTYKKHQEQFEGKGKQQHEAIGVKALNNDVLKVTCRNGEWYHYTSNLTWY